MSSESSPPPRHWFRYAEAAEYCGITERQMRRAVQAGKVAYTRPGLAVLFTREQLDEFIERSTIPASK
jgi:excisionase family DNA binding protein